MLDDVMCGLLCCGLDDVYEQVSNRILLLLVCGVISFQVRESGLGARYYH